MFGLVFACGVPDLIAASLLPSPDQTRGKAMLSIALSGEGVRMGEDGLPLDILLWRDGSIPTTKGTFKLTDRARKMVLDDWAARMSVQSPTGEGPGSFDYDHDEFRDTLPGYLKKSAGSFHLTLEGKDIWLTGCRFTSLAADLIRQKEKRSTSGAFYFDPKTGEFTSLINVGLTNLPATYNQPLLASDNATAGGIVLFPPDAPEAERTLVQVPATVLAAEPVAQTTNPDDLPPLGKEPYAGRNLGVVPHQRCRLICTDAWHPDEVLQRVRQWASVDGSGQWEQIDKAKFASAHTYVLRSGESSDCYLLLHHDIDAHGEMVTVDGGVDEACRVFAGMMAAGSLDIPREDWPAVKHHLAMHEHEFGERAPWEEGAESSAIKRAPMVVQSLILSKKRFRSLGDAKSWCVKHGYKADVDETADSYRFRQRDPGAFDRASFRTITLDKGVKAVVGHLKGEHTAAPVTTSRLSGMYSDMNPHMLAGARLRHLGEAFPMMHMLKRHASAAGHDDLAKHYGEHMERMGAHAEHLAKHAKMLGSDALLPAEKLSAMLSGADLPAHLEEMHPHHLLRAKIGHTADGAVMDAALRHLAKMGGALDMAEAYGRHLGHKAEHLGKLGEHMMRHASDARTLSCLDASPQTTLSQVMAYLGVQTEAELLPVLVDQKALLTAAQSQALTALSTVGSDVKAARLSKIAAMQEKNLLTPADAQLAQGISPATGKDDPALVPWTLAQLDAVETRALARLSGTAGAVVVAGQSVVTPPTSAAAQAGAIPQQTSQISESDALETLAFMNPDLKPEELKALYERSKSNPRAPGAAVQE